MFERNDMIYDYVWSTKYRPDDKKIMGILDHTCLDRKEGWEMLYFINACARGWGWEATSIISMNKLEKVIRKEVPGNIKSQIEVKIWIEDNIPHIKFNHVNVINR
jgi:hypothetical protein